MTEADCGRIILSYEDLVSIIMRSSTKPLPCCRLLVSVQGPGGRWIDWPEIIYWLSFALSRFLYHSSLIKLILLTGKPISAFPPIYIHCPDGFAEHKAKLMSGGVHISGGETKAQSHLKGSAFFPGQMCILRPFTGNYHITFKCT